MRNILISSPEKIYESGAFKLDVKVNGATLKNPKIEQYNDLKGIEIAYEYKGENAEDVQFEIINTTIRNKKVNFYTAYIYDPTFNPKIRLNYYKEIREVSPLVYFTCKSRGSKKKIKPDPKDRYAYYSSVEIDEWVFPTSGVVFIWKVCK